MRGSYTETWQQGTACEFSPHAQRGSYPIIESSKAWCTTVKPQEHCVQNTAEPVTFMLLAILIQLEVETRANNRMS